MATLLDVVTESISDTADTEELTRYGDRLLAAADRAGVLDSPSEYSLREQAESLLPEFVAIAEAALRAQHPAAEQLATVAARTLPRISASLAFLDASDVTLVSPGILQRHARRIAGELQDRFDDLRDTGQGLAAYNVLETLVRLALSDSGLRFRALDALTSITVADPAELAERLPHLAGVALDMWGENDLTGLLEVALEFDNARADATFELGLASLRAALGASDRAAALLALTEARARFIQVEGVEEGREDATIYRCVLDIVLAFAAAKPVADQVTEQLTQAVTRKRVFTAGGRAWTAPRRYAEAQWQTLAASLAQASDPLARPSWREPGPTLAAVLEAYRASRSLTVMTGDGITAVIEPAVASAFVRREGLAAHLRDLVAAGEIPHEYAEDARALLERVESPDSSGGDGGDAVGKAFAAAPELSRELSVAREPALALNLATLAETSPKLVEKLEETAALRVRERATSLDPLVDRMLAATIERLKSCPDFTGAARAEFTDLMTLVFRFLVDRADIGKRTAGDWAPYLFAPDKDKDQKPFTESHLQRDAGWFLKGSPLRPTVRFEENDVAAGRADLTVVPGVHRFSLEIKRELSDASPAAIHNSYAAQAGTYTATGPSMAMLLVLDLTEHPHGTAGVMDSLWVDAVDVPGGQPRFLVVGVVRGNRIPPSSTTAPSMDATQ